MKKAEERGEGERGGEGVDIGEKGRRKRGR